jgi:hypothetical protein
VPRRTDRDEVNVYAPPRESSIEVTPPPGPPTRKPVLLLVAVVFSALFMGPCGALLTTFGAIAKAQGNLVLVLGEYGVGLVISAATLGCLWGIWERKTKAVWGYVALTLLQLAVVGLTAGTTPLAAAMLLGCRAPPVVAAYYYSKQFG